MANTSPVQSLQEIRLKALKVNHSLIQKPNFRNLKAQCGFKLAELINEHKIRLDVPEYRDEIIVDLSAMLRDKKPDGEGKLELRAKDDVKLEIGRSPDVGDTILMRAWFELSKAFDDNSPEMVIMRREQKNHMVANKNNMAKNSAE